MGGAFSLSEFYEYFLKSALSKESLSVPLPTIILLP